MSTMIPAAPAVDVKHLFAAKVRRGIFRPVARHLREDLVEDRLAEGVGMAFEQYMHSVAEGRPMGDAKLTLYRRHGQGAGSLFAREQLSGLEVGRGLHGGLPSRRGFGAPTGCDDGCASYGGA